MKKEKINLENVIKNIRDVQYSNNKKLAELNNKLKNYHSEKAYAKSKVSDIISQISVVEK